MNQPRTWLTVRDVAARLGVSRQTVYRFIEQEQLRAYRVGKSIKVDQNDADEFLRYANTISWERGGAA